MGGGRDIPDNSRPPTHAPKYPIFNAKKQFIKIFLNHKMLTFNHKTVSLLNKIQKYFQIGSKERWVTIMGKVCHPGKVG